MGLREGVLAAVVAHPEGAGLTQLASILRRDRPTVLHHLRALVAEGIVERDVTASRPIYRARPYFGATWVDPASGRVMRWSVSDRVSWRYPLTSRLADKRARDATLAFLRLAEQRGFLLPPHLLAPRAKPKRQSQRMALDPSITHGLRFVVYGSAARNDMGPASDVDLLALPGRATDAAALGDALRDLAAEVNLTAPRRIDINTLRGAPPAGFAAAVLRDGFVVYSTYEGGEYEPFWEDAA